MGQSKKNNEWQQITTVPTRYGAYKRRILQWFTPKMTAVQKVTNITAKLCGEIRKFHKHRKFKNQIRDLNSDDFSLSVAFLVSAATL